MPTKDPLEIWETLTPATTWIWKTNDRGQETQEAVGGRQGAKLRITAEDREYNQMRIVDDANDPFRNGTLAPIKLHTDDPGELASPNALSRADMVAIFVKSGNAFQAAVNKIDSEVTLRTMRELAGDVDAKQSQIDYLDKQLAPFQHEGKQSNSYQLIQGIKGVED